MKASEIREFKEYLDIDDENKKTRRVFHENYEWLEGYFRSRWGSNGFNTFCNKFGEYYWLNIPNIPDLAKYLSAFGAIGDSTLPDYKPNIQVIEATSLLQDEGGTPKERYRAMMILVRQIRNNLFHGKKMELAEQDVYKRNKNLVRLGSEITTIILAHLEQAERELGF